MWERILCSCRTEQIWDGERRATGLAPQGAPIQLGQAEGWQPEQLLALAVDGSTMMTFLALAESEGLEVLAYVSSVRVFHADTDPAGVRLVLAPCIVVGSHDSIPVATRLIEEALASSPVGRSLRVAPRLEPEIVEAPLTVHA